MLLWSAKPKLIFKQDVSAIIKNRVSGLLFILVLSGCALKKDTPPMLQRIIEEQLPEEYQHEDLICYITSQYDCNLCVNSIRDWESGIRQKTNLLQVGLIYIEAPEHSVTTIIKMYKLPETIKWKSIKNVDLFEFLAKEYPELKTPIAVLIRNNQIVFVKNVSGDSWIHFF